MAGFARCLRLAVSYARKYVETTEGLAFREGFQLNYSEDQLRVVVDTIPTMAWSARPDGR